MLATVCCVRLCHLSDGLLLYARVTCFAAAYCVLFAPLIATPGSRARSVAAALAAVSGYERCVQPCWPLPLQQLCRWLWDLLKFEVMLV
jgi:hypothetical protein